MQLKILEATLSCISGGIVGISSPPTVTEQTPLHVEATVREEKNISYLATTAILRVSVHVCVYVRACVVLGLKQSLEHTRQMLTAELITSPNAQILLHVFIHILCVCVCGCVAWDMWGWGHRTTWRIWFSSSTTWVPEIELRFGA